MADGQPPHDQAVPKARIDETNDSSSSDADSVFSSAAESISSLSIEPRSSPSEEDNQSSDGVPKEDGRSLKPPKLGLFRRNTNKSLTSPVVHSPMTADYNTQLKLSKEAKKQADKMAAEVNKRKLMKEKFMSEALSTWEKDIMPNWDSKKGLRSTRTLWKMGLPPKVRGKIWSLAVGNEMNVTAELYNICLQRARAALKWQTSKEKGETQHLDKAARDIGDALVLGREDTVHLIQMDLARTFPQLGLFQPEGPMHEALKDVLQAYVCYRPDIGYVQGMSFIAAMLLVNMDPEDAFRVMTNMLNRGCHMAFFTMDVKRIEGYKNVFQQLFADCLPDLFAHFQNENVFPDMYLLDWLMTVFSKSLPLELACRVWDRYFLGGEIFLFRTALGILNMMKKRLLTQPFEGIAYDLTHLPIIYSDDEFFLHVKAVKIPEKAFAAALATHLPKK